MTLDQMNMMAALKEHVMRPYMSRIRSATMNWEQSRSRADETTCGNRLHSLRDNTSRGIVTIGHVDEWSQEHGLTVCRMMILMLYENGKPLWKVHATCRHHPMEALNWAKKKFGTCVFISRDELYVLTKLMFLENVATNQDAEPKWKPHSEEAFNLALNNFLVNE